MHLGRAWIAARRPAAAPSVTLVLTLLVLALLVSLLALAGSASASAAVDGAGAVLVDVAQADVESDTESDTSRRLVDRETSERVDAVVIALWAIAAVMTAMLVLFLWHTSPRRRLRLARQRSTQLHNTAGEEPEDAAEADAVELSGEADAVELSGAEAESGPLAAPGPEATPAATGSEPVEDEADRSDTEESGFWLRLRRTLGLD